jgi:glycosyltransferase involved in cell wall biosynthesis
MEKPKFSIVFIARNEAKTLPNAIKSLKEFMDRGGDVNLVDTGSTDGTPDLARSLGCRVKEVGDIFKHTIDEDTAIFVNERFIEANEHPILTAGDTYFDFSSARNASSEMADCDLVCTMDCDEMITKLDIDKINEYIGQGFQKFEYNFVFSHLPDGQEFIKFIQSKFYDRRICHWVGIIHEMVEGPAVTKLLTEAEFKLEHWQNPETNRSGYLKGLAVDCYNHQEKDRNSHYFARELLWNGRPQSAIKEFKRHIKMNKWPAERAESMIFLSEIYGNLGDKEQQLYWIHRALDTEPNRREPLITLAKIYQKWNMPTPANFYATAALELPWYPFYGAHVDFYTYEPHAILYWAKGWLGDVKGAQKHLLECLKFQPFNPIYLRDTKFYFEYPANDIPGWMTYEEQLWLFETAKRHTQIAELGSWKGRSTHALASGIGKRGFIVAIDTWEGSQNVKDLTNQQAKQEDVFEIFKENMKSFSKVIVNRGRGDDVVNQYRDKFFDVVFIDAGHTYEEVKSDIEKWLPKARMVIAGHDYLPGVWDGVIKAVDEKFGKPDGVAGSIWYKYLVPKISIILPTLDRPEGLKRCLDSIEALNYPKEKLQIIIMDGDDTVPIKMKRALWQVDGEYIVYAASDMTFHPDCIYNALQTGKALTAFNDGEVLPDKGNICTHFMIRKDIIPKIGGEIFSTRFFHVGCDNLLHAKAEKLGEFVRCENAYIEHNHFSKGAPMDDTYKKGWSRVEEDRKILEEELKKL